MFWFVCVLFVADDAEEEDDTIDRGAVDDITGAGVDAGKAEFVFVVKWLNNCVSV